MAASFDLQAQKSNPAFGPGTSLDVYDAADGTGVDRRPPKAALQTVVVGSDGTVEIDGLDYSHRYAAGTVVGGVWQAVIFTTEAAQLGTPIGPTTAHNPGDQITVGTSAVDVFDEYTARVNAGFTNFHATAIVRVTRGATEAGAGEPVFPMQKWPADGAAIGFTGRVSIKSDTASTPIPRWEI